MTELQIIDTGLPVPKKSEESKLVGLLSNATLESKTSTADISLAITSGDIPAVSVFLCSGGDPNFVNERGHSLLQCAFSAKNETIVEMLLKKGAGKNMRFFKR